jgi:hypothetical protein
MKASHSGAMRQGALAIMGLGLPLEFVVCHGGADRGENVQITFNVNAPVRVCLQQLARVMPCDIHANGVAILVQIGKLQDVFGFVVV